jgi:hypothetical protein
MVGNPPFRKQYRPALDPDFLVQTMALKVCPLGLVHEIVLIRIWIVAVISWELERPMGRHLYHSFLLVAMPRLCPETMTNHLCQAMPLIL